MAEGSTGEPTKWTTTVIVSRTLQGHEVAASLQREHHKVRFSQSVETGSIIFPLSGIAFLLATTQELFATSHETMFPWIENFISIHRNCFLVLTAALHGSSEWDLMFTIQQRFLGSNLRIIPAHNNAEIVKIMLIIAKATSKPHLETIIDRLLKAQSQIIERSPVWQLLDSI
ncbi:protein SPO16 homolog [Xenopus laevis]|uniref:Protein SPO16 homolog n=2 Tax=Xenopus laevis TaxID=8355 RepID=A0A1L8GMU6_XENLA|nr:protein SPO16 homolog [Xenopus laevis]OCT85172.1 hypothetical protein XELAEV_18023336mg [Xenopus laevis]